MSKKRRLFGLLLGLAMIFCAGVFIIDTDDGVEIIFLMIAISVVADSVKQLFYYFTMARFMVNGRNILYRGIITMNIGLLALGLYDVPTKSAMLYLIAIHIFAGAVDILRANEQKKLDAAGWKWKMAEGFFNIILAVICGIFIRRPSVMVYIYSCGLAYSGIMRIVDAFKRTDVQLIR